SKDRPPMLAPGIDNDIYSTVDACSNACEMWKAIKRLKQEENQVIVNSSTPIYDQEHAMVAEDNEMSKDKEIDKLMALISLSFKKIYKPTNNNLRTSSNTSRANQDNTPRINKGTGNWKHIICIWHKFKRFLQILLRILDPSLIMSHCKRKDRNKFLETSNKALVDKLKGEIEDFITKNKSLESSNNHFKEANNKLSKTNQLMFKDHKKFLAELDRYHDVNYALKVATDCAKAKGDLMSYKMESEKSFNEYTPKINDLNQTILEMKKELFVHQETISIMSQEK
nr:hypothetical protein [Tanacetum cinerariifolium]